MLCEEIERMFTVEVRRVQLREVGWLSRTSTRLKLNRRIVRVQTSICAFTLKVSHAPMLAECLLSMTLLVHPGVNLRSRWSGFLDDPPALTTLLLPLRVPV